jgi:hypothetical protein
VTSSSYVILNTGGILNCLTACLNCCHVLIDRTSRNGGLLPDLQRVIECRLVEFGHSRFD